MALRRGKSSPRLARSSPIALWSEAMALTYCGNVHAAEDLDAWLASTAQFAVPVAEAAASAGRSFGLGAWWNAETVAALATDPGAFDRVAAWLVDHDLPIWTLNVFPFGSFHADVVKAEVYRPGWDDEERLLYTRRAADVAARLGGGYAADGGETILSLSTLPLGFRSAGDPAPDLRVMARNVVRAASAFAAIEEATGVRPVLAIEPEPCCILGTAAEAVRFLEEWVFEPGAWTTVPEDVLRRHVGLCVDLCHLFVVGEDPVGVMADLARRGITVPKIQVSSCLEVRDPEQHPDALEELWSFEEARWLHQTFGASGKWALDLPDARARAG